MDIVFLGIPYEFGTRLRNPTGQKFGLKVICDHNRFYYYKDSEEDPSCKEGKVALGWLNVNTGVEELQGFTMVDCGDIPILLIRKEVVTLSRYSLIVVISYG